LDGEIEKLRRNAVQAANFRVNRTSFAADAGERAGKIGRTGAKDGFAHKVKNDQMISKGQCSPGKTAKTSPYGEIRRIIRFVVRAIPRYNKVV